MLNNRLPNNCKINNQNKQHQIYRIDNKKYKHKQMQINKIYKINK